MELVAGRTQREKIAIDWGLAGFDLRLQPQPGGVRDKSVASEVDRGLHGLVIGVGRKECEKLFGVVAIVLLGLRLEGFGGGLFGRHDDHRLHLSRIPTGQQRDVRLLACCIDVRHGVGEEVAVDIGAESWSARLFGGSCLAQLGGRQLTQFGEIAGSKGGFGELSIAGLGRFERLEAQAVAGERAAALSDSLLHKALRQRRCHLRTHRERSGRFAEERNVGGVATEGRDVATNPL